VTQLTVRVAFILLFIFFERRFTEANIYDWPEVTRLLSPWKIAATTVQMQLQVKKLGRALSQESTSEFATTNLNKLISMLFHHTKTAEEAYYVGEMARGTDTNVASKVEM
jgi:mediator of RNA polymerase II transcription subunit 12